MNARDRIKSESRKDPAQLEREIDEHRRRIEETVSVLETKMSPQHLWEQALSHGAGGGREFATRLGETVKTHPVPAVLTAIGLTWLYAGDRQSQGNGHAAVQGRLHGGQGLPGEASHRLDAMKDKASATAHGAMDSARDVADSAKHQAHRATQGFQHMLETNPLPLGAVGIAIGALLGALIPTTRQEDQLMGEASDRMAGQAKDKAREVKEKVEDKVHDDVQEAGGSRAGTSTSSAADTAGRPAGFPSPRGTDPSQRSPRRDHH